MMTTANKPAGRFPQNRGGKVFQRAITSNILFGVFCILALLALAGCGVVRSGENPDATRPPYKPAPPIVDTPTPETLATDLARPESTPVCIDNLTFLSDASIPDGTVVEANATLDKRWEVKNSGNCNWDERYRLRLIAGPAMDAAQEQALYPARSEGQVVLQILFRAPGEAGKYRSAWQAYNPDGQPFGDPIFIDIEVK